VKRIVLSNVRINTNQQRTHQNQSPTVSTLAAASTAAVIPDPAKVTRLALHNAASVADILLTTKAVHRASVGVLIAAGGWAATAAPDKLLADDLRVVYG
jgi:hypothetical protein